MIKTMSIDLETRSSADISRCGAYRYAEDPFFDILLFGVSVNSGPVTVYDLACGESVPEEIMQALIDPSVLKYAFNASFERICLSIWIRKHYPHLHREGYLNPESWRCTMVWAAYNGLPLSLEKAGAVLGFEQQKMKEGKDLIRYFCVPCKPTKANGGRTWNLPEHAPEKWNLFKQYNARDVEVEMQIQNRLHNYPVPDSVWQEYQLDQLVNDRGIRIDQALVTEALRIDEMSQADLIHRMKHITGLDNPNSVAQLKGYLSENGVEAESLGKKDVAALLKTAPKSLQEILSLRLQAAKSSVRKYTAMQSACCADGRCHGMFQFYGANRTGRWAGRIVQMQNLPQNHLPDLEQARDLVKQGDYETLNLLYPSVPGVLSELIRTAFIPRDGYKFIVADYSAIEARVLSFLAGEQWRIDLFKNGGDIYCQSASEMFKVPVEKHGQNAHLRQKGKIAELACIAEGQLVLTDHGEKPIETVTTADLLWDGESWVQHEGIIYKGIREVITYEGLTATPDHLVWVEGESDPIQLGVASANGAQLIRSGDIPKYRLPHPQTARVYDIRNAGSHHRFTVSGHLVHNCGYGGSVGALKAMGALDMGLKEEELQPLVTMWRDANPHIVRYWWKVDKAVKTAIQEHTRSRVGVISFEYRSGMLFISLPSGRKLAYAKPRIDMNRFGGESITYLGQDASKNWNRIESYGPKFVENIVQAVSRDILAAAMMRMKDYRIVGHVHDEVIIEAPQAASLQAVCDLMGQSPDWLPGIDLRADGYECGFYMKM